jgi:hypothetical protein
VFVNEGIDDRQQAGQFCNYGCLARHIEEENREAGACCRIDLTEASPGLPKTLRYHIIGGSIEFSIRRDAD